MSKDWNTKESLILRAKSADDAQAWEEFVKYYERFIFHLLHQMDVPSNDFDDLVQNVLLRLWKSLASYDPGKGRFRTWLGVVVRNAVVDHFAETRRRGKLMEQGQAFFQMLNETPSSEIEQRIESEWARYVTDLALERIRKVFSREAVAVFTMSLNEKPVKEIAEELNLMVDSVYTLKSRVKARFIREVKAVMNELEA